MRPRALRALIRVSWEIIGIRRLAGLGALGGGPRALGVLFLGSLRSGSLPSSKYYGRTPQTVFLPASFVGD